MLSYGLLAMPKQGADLLLRSRPRVGGHSLAMSFVLTLFAVAPLPKFDANAQSQAQPPPGPPPSQTNPQPPQPPASPSQAGAPPIRVPPLSPDKVTAYSQLFEKSGAENGMLYGGLAKQIFERAGLPNDVLGRIWGLSDTQGRGQLDVTEFVIAMHMLASYKSGAMRGVPNTLPPGLYEAAARRPGARVGGGSRPTSSAMQPQYSGFAGGRPQSPIARQQVSTPLSSQSTGEGWLVSPADKARFDQVFAGIDRTGSGHISGEQAVEFFGNARLPEEVLAQIWDLSDINSEGRLDKDEFAVAMYLIRQQRGTRDGRGNIPPTLPQALVPPSKRRQFIPPSQPTAPAFENAQPTKPRSAADDLFGLDAFGSAPPAQPQVAQSTGGTDAGPFANSQTIPSPTTSNTYKPFIPSSSFGQSLSAQPTGSPSQSRAPPPAATAAADDLLGDTDPNESSKLTNDTTELANLSNQVSSLSGQMTHLHGQRGQSEQELNQTRLQKKAFESRLGQLRTLYEKEVKEVKALQERLTSSKSDTKRLQQDMAMIDGSHQDLSTQHQQHRQALETDQRENAQLKERIRQVNTEVEQLKPQLEKLKSDARQQKGLVAINKKQLSTNEAERDRIKAEIAATKKEIEAAQREAEESSRQTESHRQELEEHNRQAEASKRELEEHSRKAEASKRELEETRAIPVPAPNVASPAPSTSSNPFFRRTTDTSRQESQDETQHTQNNFDNIFGPSFTTAAAPAPSTSFHNEAPPDTMTPTSAARDIDSSRASSTTPSAVEAPPPSTANQIDSSSLPFRQPLSGGNSVNSSMRVGEPASRLSHADTPRAMTPSTSTPTPPASGSVESDPFAMSAQDEEQESVRQTIPTGPTRMESSDHLDVVPGAFPGDTPRGGTPAPDSSDHTAAALGAGTAAVVAGGAAAAVSAATINGEDKGKAPEKASGSNDNFDDFFGGTTHQRTPSEQVKDFDSAFADMKQSAPVNGTAGQGSQEFPDIKELDDDDSSDYSDTTPLGFEDDFNKSPQKSRDVEVPSTQQQQPEVVSAVPSSLTTDRPELRTATSTGSTLPGEGSEVSPPNYQDAVPTDNPNHFPREYKNLLPERGNPASPPPTAGGSSAPAEALSGAPPSYGPEIGHAQNADDSLESPPTPPPKTAAPPFDFDSAFAGVGPAQAEEESSDDEEPFNAPRAHHTDFDPTFDSPSQSRSPPAVSSMPTASSAQPVSIYSAVTNGSPQPPPKDSFFGYGQQQGGAAPSTSASAQSPGGAPQASHDWDDIFAGISSSDPSAGKDLDEDEATTPTATSFPTYRAVEPEARADTSLHRTQSTTIGHDAAAITTAVPIRGTPSPPPRGMKMTPTTSRAPMQLPSPPPIPKSPDRPALGRAISTTSEHDDPILKRLTAMGWSRDESLSALEKFDYNIDKVCSKILRGRNNCTNQVAAGCRLPYFQIIS